MSFGHPETASEEAIRNLDKSENKSDNLKLKLQWIEFGGKNSHRPT